MLHTATSCGRCAIQRQQVQAQYAGHVKTALPRLSVTRARRVVMATKASEEPSSAATAPDLSAAVEPAAQPVLDEAPEEVFYEGPGSNAEFAFSVALMPTLIYAPLSMASIGRRLWVSFRFTNKRLTITNTSPLMKRTISVSYKNVKEVRTAPRAFGLWGDMVVFLRDGNKLELTGLDKVKEIEAFINRQIYTL